MTCDNCDTFDIYARGGQSWDRLKVEVIDGRIIAELDGTQVQLTHIQSEELTRWLVSQLSQVTRENDSGSLHHP